MTTPTERWRRKTLIAYLHSPLYVEHLQRTVQGLQRLASPGITFTDVQIQALSEADAQRVILDKLKEEFGD